MQVIISRRVPKSLQGQQFELFGNEYRQTSLHIGYVLDEFGVGIQDIMITCPVNSGKNYDWRIPLNESAVSKERAVSEELYFLDEDVVKEDVPSEINEEQNERFRFKQTKQKDQSKNDRTGTGGQRTDSN